MFTASIVFHYNNTSKTISLSVNGYSNELFRVLFFLLLKFEEKQKFGIACYENLKHEIEIIGILFKFMFLVGKRFIPTNFV